jgi:hypothetical protein
MFFEVTKHDKAIPSELRFSQPVHFGLGGNFANLFI